MKRYSILIAILLAAADLRAQTLGFDTYIATVRDSNIGYMAERYNIDIATANVQAARVFNDPELSFGYSNNQDWSLQMGQGYEAEVGYNLSLGGVRKARIGVARSEQEVTEAAVEDYFRNLRADATLAWLDAWRKRETATLMRSSYAQMTELAHSDSLRCVLGEINETDARQSRLEAQALGNEWLQNRTEYINACTTLAVYMGGQLHIDSIGELPDIAVPDRPLADLCTIAEERRADLQAAERSKTLSERNLRLVKASRALELGLSAGYSYNTTVRNQTAPAPAFHGFSVGVSVPLKFSSFNRGEKRAAQAAVQQTAAAYDAAVVQIRSEVTQAWNNCGVSREVLRCYDSTMLGDADAVLRSKTFGYKRGETDLLEVLTAHRTYNDVRQSYIDARTAACAAAVELNRTVGIWTGEL